MTDKVTPLFAGKSTGTEPVAELIDVLQDLLAQAQSGELQAMVFAGTCCDNTVVSGLAGSVDVFTTIGVMRHIEFRLLNEVEV